MIELRRRATRRQAFDVLETNPMYHPQPDRLLADTVEKYVQTDKTLQFRASWKTLGCYSNNTISFLVTKSFTKYSSGRQEAETSTSITLNIWKDCNETYESKTIILFRDNDELAGRMHAAPGQETLTLARDLRSATYATNVGLDSSLLVVLCPKSCSKGVCDVSDACEILEQKFPVLDFRGSWTAKGRPTNTTATYIESSPTSYFSSSLTGQTLNATVLGKFELDGVGLYIDPNVKFRGFLSKVRTTVLSN